MKPFPRPPADERGWTLIELLVVVAILGLIIPAMLSLFLKLQQGMAADEMHNKLMKLNQDTMMRLDIRLKANKRMFQKDTAGSGAAYLALVDLTAGGVPTPPPVASCGASLASAQPSATNSFSPNSGAAPASFGNCIFFAAYDTPATIIRNGTAITFVSPVTVSGTGVTYNASNGSGPATVVLDVYRFFYYYLAQSRHPLRDVNSYDLVEWKSVQYVDYNQLDRISDDMLKPAVISWLTASSPAKFPGGPITLAWDPSKTDPADDAFMVLPTNVEMSPIQIKMQDWAYITKVPTGVLSSGFRYAICGNNANWKDSPPKHVPEYAAENGHYPGGFEVGLLGRGAGLQVMTRCLLAAKGFAPNVAWNDITTVHNARDVW